MENQNLDNFYETIKTDESIRERFKGVADLNEFAEVAVRVGQEKGFDFTASDVKAYMATPPADSDEIDEKELELVAGGMSSQQMARKCVGSSSMFCYINAILN